MKLCVTSKEPSLDSQVDPRFGRCNYFLVLNEEGELVEKIPNPGNKTPKGAGIKAAQAVIDRGIEVVITGKVGPNAVDVLLGSDIEIYVGISDVSVKEAFNLYKEDNLKEYIR